MKFNKEIDMSDKKEAYRDLILILLGIVSFVVIWINYDFGMAGFVFIVTMMIRDTNVGKSILDKIIEALVIGIDEVIEVLEAGINKIDEVLLGGKR